MWRIVKKKDANIVYIKTIKDIYEDVTTRVKPQGGCQNRSISFYTNHE